MGNKIYSACEANDYEEVEILLNKNYTVKYSHLELLVNNNNIKLLKLLMTKYKGQVPIHVAIRNGNLEIVEHFLQLQYNPNEFIYGLTCLMITPLKNHNEMFDLLVKYGADVNQIDIINDITFLFYNKICYYNKFNNKKMTDECFYTDCSVIQHAMLNENYHYIAKLIAMNVNVLNKFLIRERRHYFTSTSRDTLSIQDNISIKLGIRNLYDNQIQSLVNTIVANTTETLN